MDHLVNQDDTIHDLSPLHITRLFLGDDERKDRFKSKRNDLGDNLVDDVASDW
jgi:hypothetical protein